MHFNDEKLSTFIDKTVYELVRHNVRTRRSLFLIKDIPKLYYTRMAVAENREVIF